MWTWKKQIFKNKHPPESQKHLPFEARNPMSQIPSSTPCHTNIPNKMNWERKLQKLKQIVAEPFFLQTVKKNCAMRLYSRTCCLEN